MPPGRAVIRWLPASAVATIGWCGRLISPLIWSRGWSGRSSRSGQVCRSGALTPMAGTTPRSVWARRCQSGCPAPRSMSQPSRRSSTGCRSWLGSCRCRFPGRWPPACRAAGFPWSWTVYRWIDGTPVTDRTVPDLAQFAADLAGFLSALYSIDPAGGPPPGAHNFFRGGPLAVYDGETQEALGALEGHVDTVLAAEVWRAALRATWQGRPVWFHGDAQPGNLLVKGGRLGAVIDFGTCGVGDPACDTTIAWTFLSGQASRVFRQRLPVDEATWTRGRGWAIWKAMKVLAGALDTDPEDAAFTKGVIDKIMADYLADT